MLVCCSTPPSRPRLSCPSVGATLFVRRGPAARRHAIWVAAFAVLPVLPLLAATHGAAVAVDAPLLVGGWALGALVAAAPLVRGLVGLRILRDQSTVDPMNPDLRWSDTVTSPLTWGVRRPVVVLPTVAKGWSPVHRDAAIAHERAHIVRRDWAVHTFVWFVCVGLWFHPMVWLARRAMAREAEHAADDLVLATGVRPSDYASLLVQLARSDTARTALGMASSPVAVRVDAVLSIRPRGSRRWPTWLVAIPVSLLLLTVLGPWRPWTPVEPTLTCLPQGPTP